LESVTTDKTHVLTSSLESYIKDGEISSNASNSYKRKGVGKRESSTQELLENARQQRKQREEDRKRSNSALKIQTQWRRELARIRCYRVEKLVFDEQLSKLTKIQQVFDLKKANFTAPLDTIKKLLIGFSFSFSCRPTAVDYSTASTLLQWILRSVANPASNYNILIAAQEPSADGQSWTHILARFVNILVYLSIRKLHTVGTEMSQEELLRLLGSIKFVEAHILEPEGATVEFKLKFIDLISANVSKCLTFLDELSQRKPQATAALSSWEAVGGALSSIISFPLQKNIADNKLLNYSHWIGSCVRVSSSTGLDGSVILRDTVQSFSLYRLKGWKLIFTAVSQTAKSTIVDEYTTCLHSHLSFVQHSSAPVCSNVVIVAGNFCRCCLLTNANLSPAKLADALSIVDEGGNSFIDVIVKLAADMPFATGVGAVESGRWAGVHLVTAATGAAAEAAVMNVVDEEQQYSEQQKSAERGHGIFNLEVRKNFLNSFLATF
jgi:hypothetical protein